ncbi:MAG: hypothetical protein ACT4R6_06525 [Gemmatimonadaceae bacterium]
MSGELTPNEATAKPGYRPPAGIPTRDPVSARPAIAATLLHALVVTLILLPPLLSARHALDVHRQAVRGGGNGPPGGGGGGVLGAGSRTPRERLRFFVLPKAPVVQDLILVPTPSVIAPQVQPKPPEALKALSDTAAAARQSADSAAATGGAGRDGTAGNGPGSGGGVGSGVGPGQGSGVGPGTGGGDDEIHPARVVQLPILPIPIPAKVRPYRMVAYFDVDTAGNATLLAFNPSSDGRYNKRLREMLLEMRFRPAVRRNGVPVRDTIAVRAEAL